MRDVLAELEGTEPSKLITGQRDVIAELEQSGAVKPRVFVKPDKWEEQIKPTLVETGKQIFEIPKSLAETAATLGTGAVGWAVGSGLSIAEALRPGSTRESVAQTYEDAAGRITYQPETQPAQVFTEKIGRGIEALVGPAKEAAALVGESWDSPLLEAILKFAGEYATFHAAGKGAGKVRQSAPEWYRRMTIRERGVVEGIKADIAEGEFTAAQIRELWRDPANRAALLKRYQGIGAEETGRPIRAPFAKPPEPGVALPAGQGFELRPRPSEVRDILSEMGELPPALPPGQGFELQGRAFSPTERALEAEAPLTPALPAPEGIGDQFTFRPAEAEVPVTTKAGTPFTSRKSAEQAMRKAGMDWQLYQVVPAEGGFAISRRIGQTFRTPSEPKPVKPLPPVPRHQKMPEGVVILQGSPFKVENGAIIAMQEAGLSPEEYRPYQIDDGAWVVRKYDPQKEKLKAEIMPLLAEAIQKKQLEAAAKPPTGEQPLRQAWEMTRAEFAKNQGKDSPYIQQQRDAVVKQAIKRGLPVPPEVLKDYPELKTPKVKAAPVGKGPWNLITYIRSLGGIDPKGYWGKELREFPDLKRIMKKGALPPDSIASSLNAEGWVNPSGGEWTDDILIEHLKSGQGRNIFSPEKQDAMIERQIRRLQREYEEQFEGLSAEELNALSREDKSGIKSVSLDEVASEEGLTESERHFADQDADDFFSGVKEGVPDYSERVKEAPLEKRIPRTYEPEEVWEPPFPKRKPKPKNFEQVAARVKDKPWEWTLKDLADLRPSERRAKLEKIWGPEEEFDEWFGGDGPYRRRHEISIYDDLAADLDTAVKESSEGEIKSILAEIQTNLDPWDYYAYEEAQGPPRQESLAGMTETETFELTQPETHWSKLQPKDRGPKTSKLFPKAEQAEQLRLLEKRPDFETTPKAVGGEIYYSGTSRGIPIGKYTYLTKNAEYAKNFGEDVRQFSASPEKTLDVTVQGEKVVSFEFLRKILKKEGVEITESMREKYDDIHKPIWQWIRKYPAMAEAIKSAGYDSIKQIETFTGKGKKESTLVILDQAKVNLLPTPSRPPEGTIKTGPIGSERGSLPVPEEIVEALRKSRPVQAMTHLEELGKTIYESGRTKYFDWQAAMKAALGDMWTKFKKYMVDLHARLQSGKIGPLKNQMGAVGKNIYAKNREIKEKGSAGVVKSEAKEIIGEIKKMADEYLGSISTRLGNIDPSLKHQLRKMEMTAGIEKATAIRRVEPMLQKIKLMSREDRIDFDLARKNGDAAKLKEIIDKHNMWKEYTQGTRAVLNELYQKAVSVGFDVGYRKHFHPRIIKDPKGFLEYFYKQKDWPLLERAIKEKEVELNRYLTVEEKANLINSMLRGYGPDTIKLSKPGQLKEREIELVTPELNRFYMDSDGALIRYISTVTDAIEMRRAFGVKAKGAVAPEDTIGHYILDLLVKGKIQPEHEPVLREIYSARFNEVGTRGIVGLYKNLSYIDTMGSPISAITQIGDLAWALYKNGIRRTANAILPALRGKSPITKEDIGIDMIAKEFSDTSKASHAVKRIFDATGFTKIDNIGKEVLINSTIQKAREMARNQKAELKKELLPIFEGETDALIKDLAEGRISENVKLYAFNTLADFQPIALSEMPQKYLTGGNGRLFYMLKSFTLKQFDIYRREVFQQIAHEGTRLKGLKNLARLTAAFVAANASADIIKAIILNRDIDIEDLAVDNLLRLFGISKFVTWKAREEGAGSAMVRQIAPPFKAADALTKDILQAGDEKGLETAQSIPLVGKLYYWWFGKGATKTEARKERETRPAGLNKLKGLD